MKINLDRIERETRENYLFGESSITVRIPFTELQVGNEYQKIIKLLKNNTYAFGIFGKQWAKSSNGKISYVFISPFYEKEKKGTKTEIDLLNAPVDQLMKNNGYFGNIFIYGRNTEEIEDKILEMCKVAEEDNDSKLIKEVLKAL